MHRRELLKNLGLITGAAFALPSCEWFQQRLPIALNNLNVTVEQEDLLVQLVDTIIPGDPDGGIPGAAEIQVQNFVWVMADDCLEQENQKRFMSGINQFQRWIEKNRQHPFAEILPEEKPEIINMLLGQDAIPVPVDEIEKEEENALPKPPEYYLEHIQYFLSVTKQYTIKGYMQSKYIMTEIMPYQLVPGTYKLCETIDPNKRVNINA